MAVFTVPTYESVASAIFLAKRLDAVAGGSGTLTSSAMRDVADGIDALHQEKYAFGVTPDTSVSQLARELARLHWQIVVPRRMASWPNALAHLDADIALHTAALESIGKLPTDNPDELRRAASKIALTLPGRYRDPKDLPRHLQQLRTIRDLLVSNGMK